MVRHPVLKHPLLAGTEVRIDLFVAGAATQDGLDGAPKGDKSDGKRIGQGSVEVEDHSTELHGGVSLSRQSPQGRMPGALPMDPGVSSCLRGVAFRHLPRCNV
jgi:hypothetical protein